jgi:hypothetical protein
VYLLRCDGTYAAGFKLQQQQQQQQQQRSASQPHTSSIPPRQTLHAVAGQAAADEPAVKRHKAAADSLSPPSREASDPTTAGAQHGQGSGGLFSAVIAAAAAAAAAAHGGSPEGSAAVFSSRTWTKPQEVPRVGSQVKRHQGQSSQGVSPAGQPQQQLFSGVQLLDWDGHHTQLALKRVAEEGAVISQVADDNTTHILAR